MSTVIRQLSVFGWRRALLILLAIWFIVVISTVFPMLYNSNNSNIDIDSDHKLVHRLQDALVNLNSLKKQNEELRSLLLDIAYSSQINGDQKELLESIKDKIQHTERIINKQYDFGFISSKDEPNPQYEKLRRRLQNNVEEFEFFMRSEVNKILKQNDVAKIHNQLDRYFNLSAERTRAMSKDLIHLSEVDGFQGWREKEFEKLTSLVQRRLEYLQNPVDCKTAKKVVCNLNKGCGYGCQLHHVVFCLAVAYGTQRTLILNSKGWRYNKAGWEDIYMPVSNTCTTYNVANLEPWPGVNDPEVIQLSIIDNLTPVPDFIPPAVPEDLAGRLKRIHGDPIVWWIGQLLKYLLRPQPSLTKLFKQATKNINFKKPCVGIHVRRTDKIGTEAAFHSLEEYMYHVNDYYEKLEMRLNAQNQKLDVRRVYIASDDPKVITLAKKQYPTYEVLGDINIAKTASVSTRYSERSLFGIVLDIHFLSMSDYLVCTFSSQVCRVAYELMNTNNVDASAQFRSLDDIYYYGGGKPHLKVAHMKHTVDKSIALNEIELDVGDEIHIAGNHWNGYSKGRNLRTNYMGLFPSYKVDDKILTGKFPTYPHVPNTTKTVHHSHIIGGV